MLMHIGFPPLSIRNDYVLLIDSVGRIIQMNYMPIEGSWRRFEKLYGPDKGEGACAVTSDFHYFLNRKGELVYKVPRHGIVTYGIRNMPLDTLGFFDSTETLLWKNNFERAKIDIKDELGREYVHRYYWHVGYNQTYQGKILIYERIISAQDNFKFGYKIMHINKEGWSIGYDPDNEPPPDNDTLVPEPIPKEIGFTQSGELHLPAALSGWQLRMSDMTGKTLFKGEVPHDGIVSMPPLATGIYIIQCHNPQTGEMDNRKVFKG